MKSILITGAFGQLGLACSSALQTKFRLIKTGLNANSVTNKLDISSKKSVESFLDVKNIQKVNSTGYMHFLPMFIFNFS